MGRIGKSWVFVMWAVLLTGCVFEKEPPKMVSKDLVMKAGHFHRFADNAFKPVDTDGYVKKVDNFTIIFDPSASMTDLYMPSYECVACHIDFQDPEFTQSHAVSYGGEDFEGKDKGGFAMECDRCHQDPYYSKFRYAHQLAMGINQSIPDVDLIGTLRTFGYPAYTQFSYGFKANDNTKYLPYNRDEYGRAVDKILEADGVSPLDLTLRETAKDWFDKDGQIAILIISDGRDMDKREIFAAQDLKAKYGDRICIYTILIGNDRGGKEIMDKMAQAGKCGAAINGDQLLKADAMSAFVRDVFLEKEKVNSADDKDMDGVPDCKDDCPDTGLGQKVTDNGCWNMVLMADVLFDFDKANLKPEGATAMDQVYGMLTRYPYLKVHIGGHTDDFGTMAYNIALSKRRAESGRNYLVKKGIAPERISLSWHAYTVPVASNKTAEGRALNRRLEFKFSRSGQ